MPHQSLCHPGPTYLVPTFRISIEILDDPIYVARIVRQRDHGVRPVEQLPKYLVLRALTYHDGSGCRSFKIPVTKLDLISSMVRFVNPPGIDDEILTPFGDVREKRPVLFRVDRLISVDGVMKIK